MMAGQTDWIPGVAALAAGLSAGTFLLFWGKGKGAKPAAPSAPAATESGGLKPDELLARRDALFARLQELKVGGAGAEPESIARERYETELEAARVLLALEKAPAAEAAPAPAQPNQAAQPSAAAAAKPSSGLRSGLIGAWAGATVVLLAFFMRELLQPRTEAQPSGRMGMMGGGTGGMRGMGGMGGGQQEAEADETPVLSGTLELAPGVSPPPAEAVLFLIVRPDGDRGSAPIAAQKITSLQFPIPFSLSNADSMMGQPIPEKSTLIAYVDFDGNAGTHDPAEPRVIMDGVTAGSSELRLVLSNSDAPQAAPAARPAATESKTPTASVAGGISGKLVLDPSAGSIPEGAIVFITARPLGERRGPPSAVKRLPATGFPLAFSLSQADSMMGMPFPERASIDARIDFDGVATTRDPAEPSARVESVAAGTKDLEMVLKPSQIPQR